jgi:hypothetical protein
MSVSVEDDEDEDDDDDIDVVGDGRDGETSMPVNVDRPKSKISTSAHCSQMAPSVQSSTGSHLR